MTVIDSTSIPELSSDHNPVLFEVSLDNYTSPALSTYSFPNWSKFQEILTNALPGNPNINNTNDIENAIKIPLIPPSIMPSQTAQLLK
ncbi:hypothetical protein TNCT_88651 [Trichonephila clavata]|uniref:Uncharacterized protein n=1 Tax=Trichonephila clavata TaxID=2740835 RepID=A0A8X6GS83_TRICU|nr:hypothetical protein TNCT_88651 [Trichonephila clavata]